MSWTRIQIIMSDSFLLLQVNSFWGLSGSLVTYSSPVLPQTQASPWLKDIHSTSGAVKQKTQNKRPQNTTCLFFSSYSLQTYCFSLVWWGMIRFSFLLRKNTTWMEQYYCNIIGEMRDPSTISLIFLKWPGKAYSISLYAPNVTIREEAT